MESEKVDELSTRLDALAEEVSSINVQMQKHSQQLDGNVEVRLSAVERELIVLREQQAKLIVKVTILDERMQGMLARLDKLEQNYRELRTDLESGLRGLSIRIDGIDGRLKRVESTVWWLALAAVAQLLLTGGLYVLILRL